MRMQSAFPLILRSLLLVLAASPGDPAFSQPTTRVSVSSNGKEGNGWSGSPAPLSRNGRYIAFRSVATNLVSGDTNGVTDIFVHDRLTGETTRVSVASDGAESNGRSSGPGGISADGRYVAFHSVATNLVEGDTNGYYDVFVRDWWDGDTARVSVASDGTQGNNESTGPQISADGQWVVFNSRASNLVLGDTNGELDVFVHDRLTTETTRVSVSSDGTQGNDYSAATAITVDGRYVVFHSAASNLVPGDTNDSTDVFVHDRLTGETTRESLSTSGDQGDGTSSAGAISADGKYVAFSSWATNLVVQDTNGETDIFVRDRLTGETTRVSVASDGTQGNDSSSWRGGVAMSADGRFLAFTSYSSNLVPNDTNASRDSFVHDRLKGETTRESVSTDGTQGNGRSDKPTISNTGSYVAFQSYSTNLVDGDTNEELDVFVRKLGMLADGFESGDTSAWSSTVQ